MAGQMPIHPDRASRVKMSAGELHLELSLGLGHEFAGGEIIQFPPGALVSVEGADDLSITYGRSNWASGVASGVLYAFRASRSPRRCVVLFELTGRLRASDMDAVANAAAIAVSQLVGKELPPLSTPGWAVLAKLTEDRRPVAAG